MCVNPARLEQRMGRLHRFGQRHDEVRIFNFIGRQDARRDVLATLLRNWTRRGANLHDKVFDVIGQQTSGSSIRDLLLRRGTIRNRALLGAEATGFPVCDTRLRAAVEEQRKQASSFGRRC